jgi:aspartate-semialdehyde dehydrogenase
MRVAVVGASGAVGREMLGVLERRGFPVDELLLLSSERSAGSRLRFRDREHELQALGPRSLDGVDLALFSAGSGISKAYAPSAAAAGALVVDNSSAFRMEQAVPLVVPEVNPEAARAHAGIIANPNCTTIITLMAVAPIHRVVGVERMVCASYQAASGAGARALEELEAQLEAHVRGQVPPPPTALQHPLAHNLIPHIDAFEPDGYTREEHKMAREARKILGAPGLRVSTTCVRVPVPRAHSVAVHLELAQPLDADRARELLTGAPGVRVVDAPAEARYPMPLYVSGRDEVEVGRVRVDPSHPRGLALWVVGDQLLKGAALNAVQIAELVLGT